MLTRRAALSLPLATSPLLSAHEALGDRPATAPIGLVIHSFPVHVAADRAAGTPGRFADPIRFLGYARELGAAGAQVAIGAREDADAGAVRRAAEAAGLYLEGILSLPADPDDAPRFEAEVRAAKGAGARVARTVMLSGRRYETFDSLEAFKAFADRATRSLELAVPVVERHGLLLAVENHKDWHADELIDILKRLGSDHVGVCLDTGNSMALLEDPMAVVEALAPFAFTTHFKDMGVEECPSGFLLAEVPLGTGVLDVAAVARAVRAARPEVRLNLEMITRDPLEVPCLTDRYWPTFPTLRARQLARMLAFVRAHPPRGPLPRVSQLDLTARLRAEDENVGQSLAFARDHLAARP